MKYSHNSLKHQDQINELTIKSTERSKQKIISYNYNHENNNSLPKDNKINQIFNDLKTNNRLNLSSNSQNNVFNLNKNDNEDSNKVKINKYCLICSDILSNEEILNNFFGCTDLFCNNCLIGYFKEKINTNKIEKIYCPNKDCKNIIDDYLIENFLIKFDISLLEKYKKFKQRKQLMYDPNIQLCPFPDCESYAKKGNNKFVSCVQNGHKFCFNCLKDWHEDKSCKIQIDKKFEKWKNSYNVKMCPKCKYYIEKFKGCNHITCSNCQYQWCWLCLGEYKDDHFDINGKCFGLQYANCLCFSNRLCLFFVKLSIFLLKILGIAILSPFIILISLHINFLDKYCKVNDFVYLSQIASIILLSLSLSLLLISISSFFSLLMIIIWPLQNKVFQLINNYF